MKKFIVIQFANSVPECSRWEFDTLEDAKAFALKECGESLYDEKPYHVFELHGTVSINVKYEEVEQ